MEMKLHTQTQDQTNFLSDAYLKVNSCGLQQNRGLAYTTLRADGRVDYHILYIAVGMLAAEYGGETCTLTAGDFVVYEPHQRQLYTFPAGTETYTCWIHFTGTAVQEILASLTLRGGVYRGGPDPLIRQMFERLSGMDNFTAPDEAVLNGTLLTLLGFLSRHAAGTPTAGTESVTLAIRLMRREYNKPLTVADLAASCGMSESNFLQVFRRTTGMPPHRYLMKIRMEQARELLQHTKLPISEVAAQCGFTDPLYFSRVFRRENGTSPRNWRNMQSDRDSE